MFYFCCAASSEVDLIHPFVLVRSRAQSLLSASVFPEYQVRSRSLSTSFYTTVVEFPIERTPRRIPMQWHASRDSTLRLPSQPAWNDARGGVGRASTRMRALFPVLKDEIFARSSPSNKHLPNPKMERGSCGCTVFLMNKLLTAKAKTNQIPKNSSHSRMRRCHSLTHSFSTFMVSNELPPQRFLRLHDAQIAAT